jgi:hypothetical protein
LIGPKKRDVDLCQIRRIGSGQSAADGLFDEADAFAVERAGRNIIGCGLADAAIEGRCSRGLLQLLRPGKPLWL